MSAYQSMAKRVFDVVGAASALILFAIPLLSIAAIVYWQMGAPVVFRQERTGLSGRTFRLYKFRSMKELYQADGELASDEERLTQFGRFLRASSLDELPELWNVLKGDMSFVGPRPLLPEYVPYYSSRQLRRHDVRPGLTGLAQVRGRNAVSWEDRLEADVEYVEKLSFRFDLIILVRTILIVFSRQGVSAEGHATMPRFDDWVRARREADKAAGQELSNNQDLNR